MREKAMLLRYFYDKKLAQASYLVGCAATGEALVVDPSRKIEPYLSAAQEEGLHITHVTETHIHADYVSGSRALATFTGARLYLSDMGDPDWKYQYATTNTTLIHDGDTWMVGNVKVAVIHTPGHTPEHLVFMITDTAGANKPMGIFTGDFIFVGDVGRPDLLEAAAGIADTKVKGARQQFQSLQKFKHLPDYLQIWPGHGAGSACGKALGAIPSTTLGYEKLFNPAFQFEDEEPFVNWLLDGQPEPPRYFAQMKKINKFGPSLEETQPQHLDETTLETILREGELVVDMRTQNDFAQAHRLGTISIPASSDRFNTYVGWFVDYDAPFYFIAESQKDVPRILEGLRAIGVDNIPGYFTGEAVMRQAESMPTITADELAAYVQQNGLLILDVRNKSEYQEEHLIGAKHIPMGFLPQHLDELPKDRLIATHCASGYRSQVAASLLRRYGYQNVVNVSDGIDALAKVLPTEKR